MGIKHFYIWMRKTCPRCIRPFNQRVGSPSILAVDMNAILHPLAQRVYRYGEFSPDKRLLSIRPVIELPPEELLEQMCEAVRNELDRMISEYSPSRALMVCVDGVAGAAKMQQQRQRRFRSSQESEQGKFNPNSISPGTTWMRRVCGEMEKHLRLRARELSLEIIYSDERCPGEGEHTIMHLLKSERMGVTDRDEIWVISPDADVIMLCLSLSEHFRQRHLSPSIKVSRKASGTAGRPPEHVLIDIQTLGLEIEKRLPILDFVLICALVGNDFLPQIPSLEILNGGVDTLISAHSGQPLLIWEEDTFKIHIPEFQAYLARLSATEESDLVRKYSKRHQYFEDALLEQHFRETPQGPVCIDFQKYKQEYYRKKLGDGLCPAMLSITYIHGMQWVISYYTTGIPDWNWTFPYLYGPFLSDMARTTLHGSLDLRRPDSRPAHPFLQLLAIMPPASAELLPPVLRKILRSPNSPLIEYYPTEFHVDISGKRAEWEGIVQLPCMDFEKLRQLFMCFMPKLEENPSYLDYTQATLPRILNPPKSPPPVL